MRNLQIMAKWLASQADVDVDLYCGDTACIGKLPNGRKVIRLPKHWCAVKDEESVALLEGVLDHEALGHGRFTNFDDQDLAEDRGYDMNAFTKAVSNILEDVMIETMAIATYPGVKSNLTRTVNILKEKHGFFGSPAGFATAEPSSLFMAGLLNCLRSECVPGQDQILGDHAVILHELLQGVFGDVWKTVFAIGLEVKNSQQSIDNWALTQRIVDVLKEASKGQGQGDAQGDKGDGADSKGQGQGQGDAQGDKGDGADSKGQGQGNGQGGGAGKNCPASITDAVVAAALSVLDNLDKVVITDISSGASKAIDLDASCFQPSTAPSVDFMPSLELRLEQKRIASQVSAVADDLKDALIAQAYTGKFNKLSGKRLNSRVVSRVKTGNPRIFQSKTQCDGVAAVVSLLVDTSGSMATSMSDHMPRFVGSVGVSVGLADVLSEFDVPFELSFYNETFFTQKSFDDDWNSVRKNCKFPVPYGGTTTGAAAQFALSELILRDEARKLLIVITDGDTTDISLLASCYEEAKLAGIEIASLMVGSDIPAIQKLAKVTGFPVETHNSCEGIAKYVVKHVMATI